MSLPDQSITLPEPPQRSVAEQLLESAKLRPDIIKPPEPSQNYRNKQSAEMPRLELPTDKPRPARFLHPAKTQPFRLPPALTETIRTLTRREGVTLFMTLAAALHVLLHRYTGQDDIALGTPSNIKSLPGSAPKLLVLRTNLADNPRFRALLAQVRDLTLGAYSHQQALNPQPDFNHPLCQVLFALDNSLDAQQPSNDSLAHFFPKETEAAAFDLAFTFSETSCGLNGTVRYATDLFERATVERLTGHFQTLLEGIVADPDARLSELPLLTETERRQLVVEWNDTAAAFPADKCLHELFEAQVEAMPQAIALVYENSRLSYGELNTQANRLAHYLREMGVKPDAVVAICVERGLNMVVGLLAILKAGGAYLPLDPAYPQERLAFMLEDSKPVALLTQASLDSLFAGVTKALPVIDLGAELPVWSRQPDINPDRQAIKLSPEHLAYVIYTSGSTGKPKGVMVEHRNVLNFLTAMTKAPGLTRSDTLLAVTTVAFDIAALELFLPLVNGAKIVLVSRVHAADSVFLQKTIAESGITLLQATPATWRLLFNGGWQGSSKLKAVCGGEALATDLSALLTQAVGELWNLYGPTETTIWSTGQLIERSRGEASPFEAIGRPIDNTRIYILDSRLQPVAQGLAGEIYIGGAGVSRGYLNRPELTAERFMPDPFSAQVGARMYKTGDLARWLADGRIDYLGRNDFQVKIRGFRIEIGEIETLLRQHPQLREAAVAVYEPVPEDKRLVAYAVGHNETVPTLSELRDFLKPKLPEFMLPSVFMFLDALPLTPNGKLDRKALPKPDLSRQVTEVEFTAPRTPLERQLAELWAEVLKLERIGVHDSFFTLGGHSLLAVKVIAEINKRFATDLALGAIYRSPTIEQLSLIISSGIGQPCWYSMVPIQTQGSRPPLFAIHTITLLDLPRHLGQDQPLYFLRYGMAGESSDHSVKLPTLKDVARHYISEMQQVQPEGPYYLIGFSFGGLIAYEMAQQLFARGHQVGLLGLLDTYLTNERQALPLTRIIRKLLTQNPIDLMKKASRKINRLVTADQYGDDFWPHVYTSAPDIACGSGYQAEIYPGHTTLFQTTDRETLFFTREPSEQKWKQLLGDRLDVEQVSGQHFYMCQEPHVRTLAAKIITCMDQAMNEG